jgi:hypothetical protein
MITVTLMVWVGAGPALCLDYFFDSGRYGDFLGGLTGKAVIRHPDQDYVLVVVSLPGLEEYELIHEQPVPGQSRTTIYNPRISPDGRWVTYDMWPDGIGSTNRMVVQRLDPNDPERILVGYGCEPEWWRDPTDSSLHIVYGTQNDHIVTERYPGKTLMQRFEDGALTGPAVELLDQAYKAGLSQDGRWLGTANKSVYLYDTEEETIAGLYAIEGGSTCHERMNPTADPLRMDQICFISTNHDTLLTYSSGGEIVWHMTIPQMWREQVADLRPWQSNGWSNYEDIMLTGFRNKNVEQCMALVRRSDKIMLPFCKGGPHQDLWIEGAPAYDPGSSVGLSVMPRDANRPAGLRRSLVIGPGAPPLSGTAVRVYDLRGALLGTGIRAGAAGRAGFVPAVIERRR